MATRNLSVSATLFALVFALFCPANARAQDSSGDRFAGAWEGALDLGGSSLRLVFTIEKMDSSSFGAKMDSPDQGAFGIPASKVTIDKDSVRIDVAAAGGYYSGRLDAVTDQIQGSWTQSGMEFPLALAKVAPTSTNLAETTFEPATARVPHRPQNPQPPYPYEAVDVAFSGGAPGVGLAGTLILPEGKGPFPAAILVTGSGPQDRDETIMNHKPFLVIADFLARRGIATLRYDDRGIAGSTGEFQSATTFDFAADAAAAMRFLEAAPKIDSNRVGVIGHSEGGLVALMLAAYKSAQPAFAVMLAGPAISGTEILLTQTEAIARAEGAGEEAIAQAQATNATLYAIASSGLGDSEARAEIISALMETVPFAPQEEAFRAGLEAQLDGVADALLSPWMREFLRSNPEPYLEALRMPFLALYGTSDLQVVASANVPKARQVLEKSGASLASIVVLPGLNHLFQTSASGKIEEYGELTETISPLALDVLGAWLSLAVAVGR